ncbi:NADPH:quinone reductase [Inhella proteolytica]|uniref:NADPH:quinone reductase n=1 Tax=Inhella proteolytica TaxID=2795029 RepID=A0A931J0E4_9BURK|nr:NADPH:quinone reductase [Inhella proteolytica]MBH9575353.1 NADPH:quinone reductase [Inhella proteolytica]
MKAMRYTRPGPAREVLEPCKLPLPEPGPGELRIRVRASGVNPSDVKSRARRALPGGFIVPHSDGAGVVDATGPGVPGLRAGQRVWFCNAQWQRELGSAAEFVVLPEALVHPLPEAVDFEVGACLGIPALTAWEAVHGGPTPLAGHTVLVQGGAGAVGQAAIQLARAAGARVLSTVSSPAKAELARWAGADAVLDYRHEDLAERVRALTAGRGVDRIIEINLAANAPQYPALLARGGEVCVVGSDDWQRPLPLADYLVHGLSLRFFIVYELEAARRRRAMGEIHAALESGALRHLPPQRFRLDQIATAHEAVEQGLGSGQVVLSLAD